MKSGWKVVPEIPVHELSKLHPALLSFGSHHLVGVFLFDKPNVYSPVVGVPPIALLSLPVLFGPYFEQFFEHSDLPDGVAISEERLIN